MLKSNRGNLFCSFCHQWKENLTSQCCYFVLTITITLSLVGVWSTAISQSVCLSVCLFVCSHISTITTTHFAKCSTHVTHGCDSVLLWCDGNATYYVIPFLWITSCFNIMEQMGQNQVVSLVWSLSSSTASGWSLVGLCIVWAACCYYNFTDDFLSNNKLPKSFCFVPFFSRPWSERWPHHGRTFSIYLCPSDWLFHGESCPCIDVVHPGRAWSSLPACTWHC